MADNQVTNIAESVDESISFFVTYLHEIIVKLLSQYTSGQFVTIGLSGGSLIKQLSTELIKRKETFSPLVPRLKFLFCDERFVPLNHEDSTYFGYVKLFDELNISKENVYAIKADAESVEACAIDYETRLRPLLNSNQGFDILIMGMGPDGHTCSLFPGHKLFTENDKRLVAPISDSPKPPPSRVTLTLEHINKSSYLLFCAYGESKAEMLRRILKEHDKSLPSASVQPALPNGVLKWFIDRPAAKLL